MAGTVSVTGGVAGTAARLDELDQLAVALVDAAGDCGRLVAGTVTGALSPEVLLGPLGTGRPGVAGPFGPVGRLDDPGAALLLLEATADAVAALSRAGAGLLGLGSSVAAAVAAYRATEATVSGLLHVVPHVVGTQLRVGGLVAVASAVAVPASVLPAAAGLAGLAGLAVAGGAVPGAGVPGSGVPPSLRGRVVERVAASPGLVDAAVRVLPGVLGVADVTAAARLVGGLGQVSGVLVESPVDLRRLPGSGGYGCGTATGAAPTGVSRPAGGVADLLRRSQTVAAWRRPAPGGHDSLPPGAVRPVRGQLRVDEVTGTDGRQAWVVHIPGTQEWEGDGRGSPMDMAANVALVGGRDTAVAAGVAAALAAAGARPGQPVLLVGHSQGGMTALAVAADPQVRQVATVTHVVTAGSPLPGHPLPPGVRVLALEHTDDLVPRLDGRDHVDSADVVTVRTVAPDGPWRSDAVPAHSSSAYVRTAEQVDGSSHPSVTELRDSLAPFLDREGAACRSTEYLLRRGVPGTAGP